MDMDTVVKTLCTRWAAPFLPAPDNMTVVKMLGLSIGLGALFNEEPESERKWMHGFHTRLKMSPLDAIYAGRLEDVIGVVNEARGLSR